MDITAKVPVKKFLSSSLTEKVSLDIAEQLKEKQNELNEQQRQRLNEFSKNNDSLSSYFAFLGMLREYSHKFYISQLENDVQNIGARKEILDKFVDIFQEREAIKNELEEKGLKAENLNFANLDELLENSNIQSLLTGGSKVTQESLVTLSDKFMDLYDNASLSGKEMNMLKSLNNNEDLEQTSSDEISYEMRR